MAPSASSHLLLLTTEVVVALVRYHLTDWHDRKELRASCRQLREVVDGLAQNAKLQVSQVASITTARHPTSARLLRQLRQLRIHADGCIDNLHSACWRFGALHLSALTQLTHLTIDDGLEDESHGCYRCAQLLLHLLMHTPPSLRKLHLYVVGQLHPADELAAFSAIASHCTGLETIYLVPRMQAHGLAALTSHAWPQLWALQVTIADDIDGGAASLHALARLTRLTQLRLFNAQRAGTAEGLVALSQLVGLQDLQLHDVAFHRGHGDELAAAGGPPAPHWFADVLRCAIALTGLELTRSARRFSNAPPVAAYELLGSHLVTLVLSDANISAEQAEWLMALPCLQALRARSLRLSAASRPCFPSLKRLSLRSSGFDDMFEGPSRETPAAMAAAAFPALEECSVFLGEHHPTLPLLHTSRFGEGHPLAGGLASLARCTGCISISSWLSPCRSCHRSSGRCFRKSSR